MATAPTADVELAEPAHPTPPPRKASVLVCLPSLSEDSLTGALTNLQAAFPDEFILVAGVGRPDMPPSDLWQPLDYAQPRSQLGWVLAAGDYTAAAALASQHQPQAVLLLGADVSTLPAITLRQLADTIRSGVDLAVPRYPIGPNDALVSTAILYPLTRALFAADIRFPLPVDAALSPRMLQRLASAASRGIAAQGAESLLWPVAEAALAGFSVRQVDTPERTLPAPPDTDLNTLLAGVAGSLFADIETKATFWQRGRGIPPAHTGSTADQQPTAASTEEIASLIDSFRLASNNLSELWSLVLPPQTLLALKKLSRQPPETFALDDGIWARIVYDFALGFHLRSLNRGHLLGAMTPLYLAWVASHIRAAAGDRERAARLQEASAQAFEREKPYFVSRWRWPDRFNP